MVSIKTVKEGMEKQMKIKIDKSRVQGFYGSRQECVDSLV